MLLLHNKNYNKKVKWNVILTQTTHVKKKPPKLKSQLIRKRHF